MSKRAERIHHEKRIKDKFRRVVRNTMTTPKLHPPSVFNGEYIDNVYSSNVKREQFIEHRALQMAHHPRHDCVICKYGVKYVRHDKKLQDKLLIEESEFYNDGNKEDWQKMY